MKLLKILLTGVITLGLNNSKAQIHPGKWSTIADTAHTNTSSSVGIGINDNLWGKLHINFSTNSYTESTGLVLSNTNVDCNICNSFFEVWKFNSDNTYFRQFVIDYRGYVGIGPISPQVRLHVLGDILITDNSYNNQIQLSQSGLIIAREIRVNQNSIPPDYVFDPNYRLLPLYKLSDYIIKHRHLPNIPPSSELKQFSLGEMQMKLLEKQEELVLYILELQKQIDELKQSK